MIVTLCTGSLSGIFIPTRVWPASWIAVSRFSSSEMTMTATLGPIITLSFANLEIGHRDDLLIVTSSDQRRLVNDVRKICTRESGRSACDDVYVDTLIERDLPRVYLQNALASADVRMTDDNLAVETAGTKQVPDRVRRAGWSKPSG